MSKKLPKVCALTALAILLLLAPTGCAEMKPKPETDIPQPINVIVQKPPLPEGPIVPRPPPTTPTEAKPPPPGPNEYWAWQRGHWQWNGRDFFWTPGRWIRRPAYNTEWLESFWEQREDGWHYVEGKWR